MAQPLQEFIDSRGLALRVDRVAGVIRGVKILGIESQNGRSYLPAALAAAIPLYEGAKVNVNHPKASPAAPRDYQDRIGAIHNVAVREGEGLFADLHFNPQHALAGQLAWDAEHAPENVGFSHNVLAKTSRRGDRVVVEEINKVQSVDLVADPATTRGLFEEAEPGQSQLDNDAAAGWALQKVSLAELRRHRPDLVDNVAGDLARENRDLRLQLDRAAASEAVSQRRAQARRLLAEFHLPEPDSDAPWAKAIVSEEFLAALYAAGDERAMRTLVEERARLVSAAADMPRRSARSGSPVSRDQQLVEASESRSDVDDFVRAIT